MLSLVRGTYDSRVVYGFTCGCAISEPVTANGLTTFMSMLGLPPQLILPSLRIHRDLVPASFVYCCCSQICTSRFILQHGSCLLASLVPHERRFVETRSLNPVHVKLSARCGEVDLCEGCQNKGPDHMPCADCQEIKQGTHDLRSAAKFDSC